MSKCEHCGYESQNKKSMSNHNRYGCVSIRGSWRDRNIESVKAKRAEYYRKNKLKMDESSRVWRSENKPRLLEMMRETNKRFRERSPEKVIANRRKTRSKLRIDVITAYGGKCMCCGEEEIKFLAIDHINNDGATHRRENNIKSAQAMYTYLRKNNYPRENFQILCHNCNAAKSFYGGCPHSV